jgi:hypothetical protein
MRTSWDSAGGGQRLLDGGWGLTPGQARAGRLRRRAAAAAAVAAAALALTAAAGCGGPRAATWKASMRAAVEPAGGAARRVVVDVVLTPSEAILDERAVVYGPPGLRAAGVGMPAGTNSLLPGPSAQPPAGWVLLAQGGAGGRTDPSHPLRLHNEFSLPASARQDSRALRGMLAQSRIVLVWGDRAMGAAMMQWFYNGGRSPQPPVRSSFSS